MSLKTLDVELDGIPALSVRADIVKSFLKFIVYERGLVPTHFDTQTRTGLQIGDQSRTYRQKTCFIDSMMKMLRCVEMTFQYPVEQVLILLGGNIVCPHDTYKITFPPTSEAHLAESSSRKYVAKVMKALVTWDKLPSSPLPTSTNVHLFFLLPRKSDPQEDFILPNLSFQAPQSGLQFHIHCSSGRFEELNSGLSSSLTSNISGFEPFDSSICSVGEENTDDISKALEIENDDLIWFKSPTVLKGYKEPMQSVF